MIVVDAGIVLALILPLPFSDQAAARIRSLRETREELYAPALLEYEVCSVLRQTVARKILDSDEAGRALELIDAVRIRPITPATSLHARALSWADRLGHTKAYDAHYMALAEEMGCPLLTSDLRLARSARNLGASWVETVE